VWRKENRQRIKTEKPATYTFDYVYNYTDHLGNVRVSYAKKGNGIEILEENNYYPFGLKHQGYNSDNLQPAYKYKYQGQERQDELGLNWDSFKWRNYMPDLGRFFNIDPLAEDYPYNSPFAFQENKIGLGRELEGLELVPRNPTASFGGWLSSKYDSAITSMKTTVSNIMNSLSVGKTTTSKDSSKSNAGGIAFSDGGNNQNPSELPKGGREALWIEFGGSLEVMTTVLSFEVGGTSFAKGKGTNGGKPRTENKVDDGISGVDNAANAIKTIDGGTKKQNDESERLKSDTIQTLHYGGTDNTLQKTEKSVNGKIVKTEKNN